MLQSRYNQRRTQLGLQVRFLLLQAVRKFSRLVGRPHLLVGTGLRRLEWETSLRRLEWETSLRRLEWETSLRLQEVLMFPHHPE